MNSNWQECKLGDVAEITSSKRIYYSEYVPNGVPFFRSKEIIERFKKQDASTELFIKRERYEEIKQKFGAPRQGDMLLTSVGTLGIPYLVRKEDEFYFKDGNLTWFRNIDFNAIDIHFLYSWITSVVGQQKLYEASIGSTQQALTIVGLKNIEILLPSLPEQRAIAGVLSSLDDKIDLLHRQNKTLEGMAAALWRKMFVEEADPEWKKGRLGDLVELCYGKGLKEEKRIPGKYPVYGSNAVVGYHNEFLVEGPGIVIGRKGTLGVANYVEENFFPIDTTFFIKSKTNAGKLFFEYFLLKEFAFEDMNSDSAVPGLNREIAESMELVIPMQKSIMDFNVFCEPLFTKKLKNDRQVRTLSRLRDTLLPKLMNGEVRVELEELKT